LGLGCILDSDHPIEQFTDTLINIANNTIPKSKKHNTVWFNDDCKTAIKARRKARNKLRT